MAEKILAMSDPVVPGWSVDREYNFDGTDAYWHEDCPTPTHLLDGSEIGGIAYVERVHGHVVGLCCSDCDAVVSLNAKTLKGDDGTRHIPR